MATVETSTIKIKKESQASLLSFARRVTEYHVQNSTELHEKMDIIDRAYSRYSGDSDAIITDGGVDVRASDVSCDIFNTGDKITPPVVVAQVDAYVAYLADIFCSGSPLFPVVSSPSTRVWAEQLETLLDDHAMLGGYARQFLLFLRDGIKYNYSAVEIDWDSITQFSTLSDFVGGTGKKLDNRDKYFNRIKRINPRNIIRDPSVLPGDVAEHGDYVGYVERLSMTQMKRYLIKMGKQDRAFNITEAMNSGHVMGMHDGTHVYTENPQVSEYVSKDGYTNRRGVDWDAYAAATPGKSKKAKSPSYGNQYEKVVLYARIIPSDHGIIAPQPNTPQIWRIVVVNNQFVVAAHRIISAYDFLPILIGQPMEDGFGDQTQSVAEGEIPFQEGASKLFNIRFAAARRSVSDRALYNSNVIKASDVNSKAAAPKIPVNISPLTNVTLESVYKQIPFDMRGTESTIQDAQIMIGFSKELHGLNNAKMGQFQKGNKSVTEWNDTMGGADNRLRLPALVLEYQVFAPMKSIMTLNIFQNGDNVELVSQKTGEIIKIDVAELRKHVLSFKLADGYSPKSKLASTEMIAQGMQMIGQSQILQQSFGTMLPGMFIHLMSLGGVKGLEEYDPSKAAAAAAPPGLQDASLQTLQAGMVPQQPAPNGAPTVAPELP